MLSYGISSEFGSGVHSLSVHTNMYQVLVMNAAVDICTMYDDISSTVIMLRQFDQ